MPITEDLGRATAVASVRRLMAGLLRRDGLPPAHDLLSYVEALKSPSLKGSTRRLALGLLLDSICLCRTTASSRNPALRRIAELARRFDLPRLQARALALATREALGAGSLAQAATDISDIIDALESRDATLAKVSAWPQRLVPREVWEMANAIGTEDGDALAQLREHHDCHIIIHAIAHRLSRRVSRGAGVDSRRESALRAVLASAAQSRVGGDIDALLTVLTDHARQITKAERTCVVLVPTGGGQSRIVSPSPRPDLHDAPWRLSDTVIERALSSRAPLLLHDVFGDSELIGRPSVLSMSLRSVLCVPILRGDEVYGVMYADSSEGAGSFDSVDLDVLSLFSDQAAAALDAARLFADLQSSYVELKAAQDRLIRGERLRVMGEMTSGVAHEFNNLLTAILARVQLMDLGELPEGTHEHLRLIEKASLDAAAVVRRLQGFSRSQRQGSHKLIDLAEIGADVVELLRPLWTTRRRRGLAPLVVRYRAARGLLVSGDPTELREVFTNLIKNALDALDSRGGAIDVVVAERGGVIHASVSDDGDGIPPEFLARLFTPFLTTKGDHGTGLGLCLCQQILERHGSKLKITSELTRGTTASFELAAVRTQTQTAADANQSIAKGQLRVLVVDDDPNVLQPLCDYLTLSGLCVAAAEGGRPALDRAAGFHPDVVVSDIAMPGMDGIDLCAALRKGDPGLPVVLMSGQASEVDLGRIRNSGASALLPKPFTMRQILELLQSIRLPVAGCDSKKHEIPTGGTRNSARAAHPDV